MRKAATDLPMTMMKMVAMSGIGFSIRMFGSNSMPTETKNRTAKASRSGRLSWAARWLSSLSASTMPAKKAPSASETPNIFEAPKATPSAIARTPRRKSSREPV